MPWRLQLLILLMAGPLLAQPEGVLLPEKEYKRLLEELEAAKRSRKPMPPTACRIRGELKRDRERPLAILEIEYEFRTVLMNSPVLLGGARAFATKARLKDGTTPVLEATADGLLAWIEKPGDYTLIVTFETAIGPRGTKGEPGFEIGLPRAAVTTLALASVPADLKAATIGVRLADAAGKPGELKLLTVPLPVKEPIPLGATETLDLAWESAKAEIPVENTLELDVAVTVDSATMESVAMLKLAGPLKEWTLLLPAGAELTGDAEIGRPAAKKREWTVRRRSVNQETVLTATLRQPRSDPKEVKAFGVGPYLAMGVARQSGTLKLLAPPTLRLIPKPAAELRRIESPFDPDSAASFRFSLPAGADKKAAVLLDVEVRPAVGFLAAQSHNKLQLTRQGWKLTADVRLAPVRMEAGEISWEVPAGWQNLSAGPPDLVDLSVTDGDGGQRIATARLTTPRREPFELTLEAIWPAAMDAGDLSLVMPKLRNARERESKLTVSSSEAVDVIATMPEIHPEALPRIRAGLWSGPLDGPPATIELAWRPVPISCEVKAEATLGERQIAVKQVFHIVVPEGVKTLRFQGPAGMLGFRSSPALEPLGSQRYVLPASREVNVSVSYSVPWTLSDAVPLPMMVLESGRGTTSLDLFNVTAGRSIRGFAGAWREAPPGSDANRLPVLSLLADGHAPLTLQIGECEARVVVERAFADWWIPVEGPAQGRGLYLLKQWPAELTLNAAGGQGLLALVDGTPVVVSVREGEAVLNLPEANAGRTQLLLELRYAGPEAAAWERVRFEPPCIRGAVYREPLRLRVRQADAMPTIAWGSWEAELAWRWSWRGLRPIPAFGANLERWVSDGGEIDPAADDDEGFTARQWQTSSTSMIRVPPWAGFLAGLGIAAIVCRLAAMRRIATLVVMLLLLVAAVLAWPLPASQCLAWVQPGVAVVVLATGIRILISHLQSKHRSKLETFSRGIPTETLSVEERKSSRSRPIPVQSA